MGCDSDSRDDIAAYINVSATLAAAKMTATRKAVKYVTLPTVYTLHPIAFEPLGPMNYLAVEFFLSDLGAKNRFFVTQARRQRRSFFNVCRSLCSAIMLYRCMTDSLEPKIRTPSHSKR